MSWFLSPLYDRFMRSAEEACLAEWRQELLGGLTGYILEIGAGTGANLGYYTSAVERLVLTEPDAGMRTQIAIKLPRCAAGSVEVVNAGAESLPADDGSLDAVVTTLVMCSVNDQRRVVTELHRVLRPGGVVALIEHVAADDRPDRLWWQERIEPLWKRTMGNCHLTRRPHELLTEAGFDVSGLTRQSMRKAMPIVRPTMRGLVLKQ